MILGLAFLCNSCNIPRLIPKIENRAVPTNFNASADTTAAILLSWRDFFTDTALVRLIDTALVNNQELLQEFQEVVLAQNEIRWRKAALLPAARLGVGGGLEKVGRYTSRGAAEEVSEIAEGRKVPSPLSDFNIGVTASWEIEIWNKLHNARRAAVERYLATVEGKNYLLTGLISEIAATYYELRALDNQLEIVRQSTGIQERALDIMKVQKMAGRTTELAVQKFEAEVLHSRSLAFDLRQRIKETENQLYLLSGKYPDRMDRDRRDFLATVLPAVKAGVPSQLLRNRPDIQRAEHELEAARLDIKVARAEFFPSLGIKAGVGLQAFNPKYLTSLPESLIASLAGDLVTPLINRNAIKAEYYSANARQLKAVYEYERSLLKAVLEVSTGLYNLENLEERYQLQTKQVAALNRAVEVSGDLFQSARADYLEVLTTQRDALEAKLELVDTKKEQVQSVIHLYRALGGGWQ